jgi:hypothetical protein
MRKAMLAIAVAAFAAAGCDEPTVSINGTAVEAVEAGAETYTFEVLANEGDQVYLFTDASDGTMAAARVTAGVSSFLEPGQARTLLSERQSAMGAPTQEQVSLRLPGLSLEVHADDAAAGGSEAARVSLNVGGQQLEVNANGQGETGQVQTRIAGLTAETARAIIVDLDEVDPGVQQQMLDALGL